MHYRSGFLSILRMEKLNYTHYEKTRVTWIVISIHVHKILRPNNASLRTLQQKMMITGGSIEIPQAL